MKIKDLINIPFDGYEFEFFDAAGEVIFSTFEARSPQATIDFYKEFGNTEITDLTPGVLNFICIGTTLNRNLQ